MESVVHINVQFWWRFSDATAIPSFPGNGTLHSTEQCHRHLRRVLWGCACRWSWRDSISQNNQCLQVYKGALDQCIPNTSNLINLSDVDNYPCIVITWIQLEQFCNPCKYSVTASKHDFTVNAFTGVSSGGGFSMHTQPWYMQVLSFYYLWSFFCVCLHFFFNVDPSLQIRFSLNCERVVSYVDNFGWVTHWKCVEKHLSFFMIM